MKPKEPKIKDVSRKYQGEFDERLFEEEDEPRCDLCGEPLDDYESLKGDLCSACRENLFD